jgi:hypothetical protein
MSGIQSSIKLPILVAVTAAILQIVGCRSRPAEQRQMDNGPAQTAEASTHFSAPSEGARRDLGEVLRTLIAQATSSPLRRIEVFCEPPSIENFVALNPDTIRRQSKYRIEIWPPRLDNSLLQALKQTSVRRSDERPETNWALDITLKNEP